MLRARALRGLLLREDRAYDVVAVAAFGLSEGWDELQPVVERENEENESEEDAGGGEDVLYGLDGDREGLNRS